MKIARLHLKAYGAFSDRLLDFGDGANFHVIYGPNEAGKSTTLRALTGLLFGINERTADKFLHPQLRVGATLLTQQGTRLSVMRRNARKQTLFALDEATGMELTDQPVSDEAISRLLGGLDEALYRSLFGLDMEGLTRGSEALLAGKGEIGQSLFEAAAGMASLQQLLGHLDSEASALFRPRASSSVIHIAIKEFEEKRKLMRDATVRTNAWEQADRAKRQAEEKHTKARNDLAALREEHRRLSRISANLPLAAERLSKLQELDVLQHVPLLPPEAAQQRIEAEERLRAAVEVQREARAEIERLQTKRSALVVREALLANAATIERLHHAATDWRGAVERMPRIERDIIAAETDISRRLTIIAPDLAPGITTDRARRLIPAPTLAARIQALADEYATLHAKNEQLTERFRTITGTLEQLRVDLAEHPEQAPLGALEAVREEAAGRGDLAGQQAKLDREIAALDVVVTRDASALWSGALDDLTAVRVPLTATLREFEAEYRRLDGDQRVLQEKDDDLARDISERERELRGLTAAGEIATHEQVHAARLHRDDGWHRIRQGYIERAEDPGRLSSDFSPGLSLPAAYEGSVREADRLADLLHADAGRAANFETTRQRVAEMQNARIALANQRDGLSGELGQLDIRWGAIATALGQSDITPAAAIEWCQKHTTWVERYAQLSALRQARQEITALLATTRGDLSRALTGCGLAGITEQESLVAALARAKVAVDAVRQAATARAALVGQITQQERDLADTTSQQSQLTEKVNSWQSQWHETVVALHLSPGALPAEARARIDEFTALEGALDKLDELTREGAIERGKRTTFEETLSALASAIGESTTGKDADHVVFLLYEGLAEAREADRESKQIKADVEREVTQLQQAELAESSQRERLVELTRRAGVQSPDELPSVETDSARKQLLSARIAEIDEQLVRSGARPIADVLAEIEGHDMVVTAARLTEVEATITEHEAAADAAYAQLLEASRAFDAIDGSDAAARAQQEAEELIARIARHAHSYARTRLAQAVVSRVVQSYREQHQGPVLRRAGEIFGRITLGSFSSLVTDYDDDMQVLLGQRPDNRRVGVAGMSQGARDQLFLALRIAAIEEHLKQREAIPLVIDDLLVQFDDARASATLSVLADLAQHTQVLFFTHHGHLCELAASVLQVGTWQRHDLGAASAGS
ncbi:YhaN family protein [Ferrovum sp.]|uniref:YhaN family protein n=1 Tax=Ferrovum sp. TaxID=2609467 RepID=UPI0026294DCA|nr:YhaN family protein [Ferrovum sp.]